MAEWWHGFGRMVARNWQSNDNDLAEHLCYNPNVKNWDFGRSPSFPVYELIKKEYFPVIRVGSLIRIPKEPFDVWLDGLGN